MPNLAARLLALAEPNTIVIADSTRRQVGSVFALEDLGFKGLKGFTEPDALGGAGREPLQEPLRSVALR